MMLCISILVSILMHQACAWDANELELFDLIEEVNGNFYEIMGISQDAAATELRKAYRRLSLLYHPDKNKEDGAEEKFRQIVAIYEVLKDEEKKLLYDNVLQNGLPTWRQPVFYYRRVRKMSILELMIFLLILSTGAQYIFYWSVYIERKYELEEVLMSKFKKRLEKKARKAKTTEHPENDPLLAQINLIPKPSFRDLLPFQISRGLVALALSAKYLFLKWKEAKPEPLSEEEAVDIDEFENEAEVRIRKPHRRRTYQLPELSYECILDAVDEPEIGDLQINGKGSDTKKDHVNSTDKMDNTTFQRASSGKWTEEELITLTKVINKFPGGTAGRWEKIASATGRSVADVIAAAKKLKSSTLNIGQCVSAGVQGITGAVDDYVHETEIEQTAQKMTSMQVLHDKKISANQTSRLVDGAVRKKTSQKIIPDSIITKQEFEDCENIDEESALLDSWSQLQQKALELALVQFPKGVEERWEMISKCVPDKTKEECILRYKYLVEVVKKKRQVTFKNVGQTTVCKS